MSKESEKRILIDVYQDRTNSENKIDVEVAYKLGGLNWFNGDRNKRGFYVIVQPYSEKSYGLYISKSYWLGSGFQHLLVEVSKFSTKARSLAISKMMDRDAELTRIIQGMILASCDRAGIDFTDYDLVIKNGEVCPM